MDLQFRLAKDADSKVIWNLLKMAILRRKKDGSNQWQDGYPNMEVIINDIQKKYGYVLTLNDEIVGYCALLVNDEPDYLHIEGEWLTNDDFIVFHRFKSNSSSVLVCKRHPPSPSGFQIISKLKKHWHLRETAILLTQRLYY